MDARSGSESLRDRLLDLARAEYGQKSIKFLAATVFNVVFGQLLLVFFSEVVGLSFRPANLAAVTVGAGPSYLITRYWVWQKSDKNHLFKEVLPFWALTLAGLGFSTYLVGIAERYSDSVFALMGTNLLGFGCVWVTKFFILDRVLFKQEPLTDDPLDALVDEALHRHDSSEHAGDR